MNILIVDDNANNRMVLKLLIDDFCEENRLSYVIDESVNGLQACKRAESIKYNLIFMDIVMPEMDGIEATKKIRQIDKDAMIIAVSAVDDAAKQKEILRNGAEDYVSKPIDKEQLFSRLENYVSLLSLRQKERNILNPKSVNLYTQKILHRQTIFYVENEEALSEFWEYYLLRDEPSKLDGLSDVVRAVFRLGEEIVKLSAKPWIIVEADHEAIYFTLNKIDTVGSSVVELIMAKNKEVEDFKYTDEKISFKLDKIITIIEDGLLPAAEMSPSVPTAQPPIAAVLTQAEDLDMKTTDIETYRIFNYMDPDDMAETEELLSDISSLMLMLGSSNLEAAEIDQITNYLEKLGKQLGVYTESYVIGQALASLSREISAHSGRFLEIANELSTLSSAFVSDLQNWFQMTFYKGAPSIDFMDATIVANSQMISSMLSEDDTSSGEADMDDIFDF